jgi:predicted phosphodiesterase
MKISDKKLKEVIDCYLKHGEEKACDIMGLNTESLGRYLREARNRGIESSEISQDIRAILDTYSAAEIKAIAKGGRFVPGISKVPVVDFDGVRVRVGHMTDTHIGSAYTDPERVYQAFEEFRKEKVDFVTHSGDVTEGMSNRPGHIYELAQLGYSAQKEEAINIFSQWTDTDIYAIDGNHDRWFIKSSGAKIVEDIDSAIDNFHFIGHDEGDISLGGKATLKLWHGEDGNSYALCLDDQTEVFTDNGWKLFKDLQHNEMVATLNPSSNKLEFQLPTDYIAQEYSGDMISFQGQKYDMVVTPDHRMWVRRAWKDKWEFVYAKDITQGRQWKINRVIPNWDGYSNNFIFLPPPSKGATGVCKNYATKVDIKLWAEFVGWMLSEGNLSHANQRVEISQNKQVNPDKCERIVSLIQKMGFTCYQDDHRIVISSKQLYEIFKGMGHSHEKQIDASLKNAKKDVLLALLDGLFLGDGTIKNGKYQNYTTNSPQLADDVQEILLKCGISAVIKKYNDRKSSFNQTRPIYQISCSYQMTEPGLWNSPRTVPYNGMVYCVSVPNQIILVRRNGKVAWTGNSYRLQKILESLSGGEKPSIMVAGHTHKYVNIFERNVYALSAGSIQRQTPWMRGKRIAAHVGFVIADYWINDSGVSKFTHTWYPFYT